MKFITTLEIYIYVCQMNIVLPSNEFINKVLVL